MPISPYTSYTISNTITIYNWSTTSAVSGTPWWARPGDDGDRWIDMGRLSGEIVRDDARAQGDVQARATALVAADDERRRARAEATDRAVLLLRSILTPEQCASMDEHDCFEVIGSAGGRYRIRLHTVNGNIEWLDADGRVGGRICAHPTMAEHWLPMADVALAQLLALTTDERAFAAVANLHEGQHPPVLQAA